MGADEAVAVLVGAGVLEALDPVVTDDGQDDRDDCEDRDGCGRDGACFHGPDCNGVRAGGI